MVIKLGGKYKRTIQCRWNHPSYPREAWIMNFGVNFVCIRGEIEKPYKSDHFLRLKREVFEKNYDFVKTSHTIKLTGYTINNCHFMVNPINGCLTAVEPVE